MSIQLRFHIELNSPVFVAGSIVFRCAEIATREILNYRLNPERDQSWCLVIASFIPCDHCAHRLIILSLWETARASPPPSRNLEGSRLLFLTPTRSNRIIDGIKRRSVWVSLKQRPVEARARTIVKPSWQALGVDRRRAKPVPDSLVFVISNDAGSRPWIHDFRTHVCARTHRGGSLTDEVPRSFIGLPVIMIMPHDVRADLRKAEKGDALFSPVFYAAPANFLLARDKNVLEIEWRLVVFAEYLCIQSGENRWWGWKILSAKNVGVRW